MEVLAEPYEQKFPMMTVYAETLEKIVRLVLSKYPKSNIKLDNIKIDSAHEIVQVAKNQPHARDLSIYVYDGDSDFLLENVLYLTLCSSYAVLKVPDKNNTDAMGLAAQIKDILASSCHRWNPSNYPMAQGAVTGVIYGLCVQAVFYTTSSLGMGLLGSLAALIIIVAISGYYISIRHCRIYLTPSSENPSFIKRNKDNLLMMLVGAVIGGCITLLVTLLVARLQAPAGSQATTQPASSQPAE